jgi:glycosyltransferase involved in cell wall biosynthesis
VGPNHTPPPTAAQGMLGSVIAVCLASCEPPPELLEAQLRSLRAQVGVEWSCLVDDDASSPSARAVLRAAVGADRRFDVVEHDEREGAYRNFERCLARVPPGVEAVALCDQDDVWDPDKLATLSAALSAPGVTLAFSDVRVVRADGTLLSPTYWVDRDRGHDDLAALLTTNVVTGAAALVRRDVVDVALPFPPELDGAFHDHWLACVALALGELAYVERPLVDYVQHDANAVGHARRRARGDAASREPLAVRAARDRERHVLRPQAFARALLERCGGAMAPARRRAAERVARGDGSARGLGAILAGAIAEQLRPRRTLEARRRAARGALLGRRGSQST